MTRKAPAVYANLAKLCFTQCWNSFYSFLPIPAKPTLPEFRIMVVKIGEPTSNTVTCGNFRNTL